MTIKSEVFSTYRTLLQDKSLHHWVLAELLTPPSESKLAEVIKNANLDDIHDARELIMTSLANELLIPITLRYSQLDETPKTLHPTFSQFDITAASRRRLQSACLTYLSKTDPNQAKSIAKQLFNDSLHSNMTDTVNALEILIALGGKESETALDMFYQCWQDDFSAMNNWFRLQAASFAQDTVANVRKLLTHPAFDMTNPTTVFALFAPFIQNTVGFHLKTGEGYQLLTDVILEIEKKNPTLAAKLVAPFNSWDRYDTNRQQLMHDQLIYLSEHAISDSVKDALKAGLDKPFNNMNGQPTPAGTSQMLKWMRAHPTLTVPIAKDASVIKESYKP